MSKPVIFTVFFTVTDRFQPKKTQPGVGGNGSHSSGIGMGPDFSSFFAGLGWDRIFFCGSGTGEV